MSRVAKAPVVVPAGVDVKINGQVITIKGKNGELTRTLNDAVEVKHADNTLTFGPRDGYADGWAQAGTARALLNSMVIGVTEGFTKKLQLVGVGYRAAVKGNVINLSLGFSHPGGGRGAILRWLVVAALFLAAIMGMAVVMPSLLGGLAQKMG